jgi:hypothetical protein
LAGTAIICIVAAFGAAFLVARAVKHPTPAHAATTSLKTTRVADTVTTSTSKHQDAELLAQFSPQRAKLKPRPKPKPKHKAKKAASPSTPVAPVDTTPTDTTPAYTAPAYTTPTPVTPAPSHSSGSTHKKSGGGSSGGSGTTTIGG